MAIRSDHETRYKVNGGAGDSRFSCPHYDFSIVTRFYLVSFW